MLTVRFTLAGREFIALNGGLDFPFTEAMSLSIRCDTQREVDFDWQSPSAPGPAQAGRLPQASSKVRRHICSSARAAPPASAAG